MEQRPGLATGPHLRQRDQHLLHDQRLLPLYLDSVGRPDQVKSALIALNVGQLPASFLLIFAAGHLVRRVWPYVWGGIASFVCMGVIVSRTGLPVTIASAVLGFSCGMMLTLVLALPPLLCAPEDVARTSAALFTLAYGCAVIVPIVSGALWDVTGIPGFALCRLRFARSCRFC